MLLNTGNITLVFFSLIPNLWYLAFQFKFLCRSAYRVKEKVMLTMLTEPFQYSWHYISYFKFAFLCKYISREFPDKESAMCDPEVRSIRCCICGARSRQKLRWFSVNARNYYSTAICPNHGYIKGKIRMLHGINGGYFAVKTIKVSSEHEAQDIAAKKAAIVMKRKKRA